MSRTIVRSLLGGGEGTLGVPLALATAARIQERDWEDFLEDPTQLANGIRDLVDSAGPDGVPVSHDDVLLEQAAGTGGLSGGLHAIAAVEATRRLRQSLGDRVALVAFVPGPARVGAALGLAGPASVEAVVNLGKAFLAAGVDVVLVRDAGDAVGELGTLANIARFHQALAVSYGEPSAGLPLVTQVPIDEPTETAGVVVTDGQVARDVEFTILEEWIDGLR